MSLDAAVEQAVNECIQEEIMEDFLWANKEDYVWKNVYLQDALIAKLGMNR